MRLLSGHLYYSFRWWNYKVQNLKLAAPLSILPSVSCQEAINIMNAEGYDQLPVIQEAG